MKKQGEVPQYKRGGGSGRGRGVIRNHRREKKERMKGRRWTETLLLFCGWSGQSVRAHSKWAGVSIHRILILFPHTRAHTHQHTQTYDDTKHGRILNTPTNNTHFYTIHNKESILIL